MGKGWTVLGVFITIILALIIAKSAYWLHFQDGKAKLTQCFVARQRKLEATENLPDDMDMLKTQIAALIEHTGLEMTEEEDEEAVDDNAANATNANKIQEELSEIDT